MGNPTDMWGLGGIVHQWLMANPHLGVQMGVTGIPANDDPTIAQLQERLQGLQTENQVLAQVLGPEGAGGPTSSEAADRYRQAMRANGMMMDQIRSKIAGMRPILIAAPPPRVPEPEQPRTENMSNDPLFRPTNRNEPQNTE